MGVIKLDAPVKENLRAKNLGAGRRQPDRRHASGAAVQSEIDDRRSFARHACVSYAGNSNFRWSKEW
jgi:hypothetical protein